MIVEVVYLKRLDEGLKIGVWNKETREYTECIYEAGRYNPDVQMSSLIDIEIKDSKVISIKRIKQEES